MDFYEEPQIQIRELNEIPEIRRALTTIDLIGQPEPHGGILQLLFVNCISVCSNLSAKGY